MPDVQIQTDDGLLLQARHRPADAAPTRGAALLCHPHPAFGGHMDVWLLPTIAARLARDGWASLRINFRGVEGSQGRQTAGLEEHLDVAAGVDWLRREHPGVPLATVGWSFGAAMALRAGPSVAGWVGIAPPTQPLPDAAIHGPILPADPPPRRTVVGGAHHPFFPPDPLAVLAPDEVVVLPDADHFLFDRDHEVADAVAAALAALTPTRGTRS